MSDATNEPPREWLDAFIQRAGFSHGWENLESWARRMAEQAWRDQQPSIPKSRRVKYRCRDCKHEQWVHHVIAEDGSEYVGSGRNWCDACQDGLPQIVQREPVLLKLDQVYGYARVTEPTQPLVTAEWLAQGDQAVSPEDKQALWESVSTRMREAQAKVRDAVAELDSAADAFYRAELKLLENDGPAACRQRLPGHVRWNGSAWSGGNGNADNIIEYILRRNALDLLGCHIDN